MDTTTAGDGFTTDRLRAAAFLSSVKGTFVREDDCYVVQLARMLIHAREEGRTEAAVSRNGLWDARTSGSALRVTAEIEYQHKPGRYS